MADGHTTALGHWLQRLEAGCPDAQEAIIQHTCQRLRWMAKAMLRTSPRVRRWAETDDLLQDAMISLHQSLAQVKPTTTRQFYGLASTHLRRRLIELARKHYGPQGIETKHEFCENEKIETVNPKSPESLDDWPEFHQQVDCLPSDLREVFELIFYQGMKQTDAAKLLGIGLATLKRRWQAARVSLSETLQGTTSS